MATCPAGHQTTQTDFCDVCGLPVSADPASAPASPAASSATIECPNCHATNVAEALFCEACGYDFTTATLPADPAPVWPTLEPAAPEPPAPAQTTPVEAPATDAPAAETPVPTPATPADAAVEAPTSQTPVPVPAPSAPTARKVEWVAELWIDPDWYASQGSTDPMPSAGLPDIVPLVRENNLIGRVSQSRSVFPQVECDLDSGVSRRHAMLSTDGSRWWIEDLNSANGTFVGNAAGPLPAMPIPAGRVELSPGQRIYVGAWTRIVIRRATEDEQAAFAG